MDKGSPVYCNLPLIQRHTPIKRLGLSRKRRSCESDNCLKKKIQACSEKLTSSSVVILSDKVQDSGTVSNTVNTEENEEKVPYNHSDENINYVSELETLVQKFADKEKRLAELKLKGSGIVQLENLTEVWKNGCKNAYIYLIQLIKERQWENVNNKTILNNLGILKIMRETFESDGEISLSDSSQ